MLINTLKAKKQLVEGGFSERQAETVIEVMITANEQVATKQDLNDLRQATKQDLDDLRQDLEQLRQDTEHGFEVLQRDLEQFRQDTEQDFEILRRDTTLKIYATSATLFVLLAALNFFT